MSQSYKKSCMYCNKEIELSDKASGRWLPYDLNGSVHECSSKTIGTGTKKVETNSKPLTVEERLAILEAFFFKGDKK